ncbi:MAG: hypothetical protein SGI86_21130 [Deltaproteobacteria bacterium]|nr:hypothetical protein [Deltaproteobacteria bacterium]
MNNLTTQARTSLKRYLPVLLGACVLIPHALYFDFLTDDAYISFRYARNLAEHGELVFNLGERVEGYTNFLWTILLALGMKLGVGPEISSRVLGVVFGVGGLAVVTRLSLRLDDEQPRPGHFIAPVALAATSAYACWTTGGLETQLFTFLFLLGTERYLHETLRFAGFQSSFYFGLASLTRPEGPMFFCLAAAFRFGHNLFSQKRWRPTRDEWLWLAIFTAIFVPYVLWRISYYGHPFPNTYYVKASGNATGSLKMGLYYLRRFAEDHTLWFWVPFIVAGWPRAGNTHRRLLFEWSLLVAVVFCLYVAKVGGDFMGLYRFVLPLIPLGAILVQEAARNLAGRLTPLVPRAALAVVGLTLFAGHVIGSMHTSHQAATLIGADNGIDTPGYLKFYADERVPIGRWFGQHARPDDLMTLGGAGVIAYYSMIPGYDVFGLVDETIAHDATMTHGARPGHQKWGTDAYMVSRRPTLITHYYRIHENHAPDPDYWRQLGYAWVTATIPGLADPPLYSFLKRVDRSFGPLPASADGNSQRP